MAASHPATADRSSASVLAAVGRLVASTDAETVFASLVRACVPSVCAAATIEATSTSPTAHHASADSVVIPIEVASLDGRGALRAVLRLRYDDRVPGDADALAGRLMVDHAVALIERERAATALAGARQLAEALSRALESSREIGMAVGIVMARHTLTSDQGFDVLRRVSQRRNEKLRDIALEVVRTGQLDLPAGVTLTGPAQRLRGPVQAPAADDTPTGPATSR